MVAVAAVCCKDKIRKANLAAVRVQKYVKKMQHFNTCTRGFWAHLDVLFSKMCGFSLLYSGTEFRNRQSTNM